MNILKISVLAGAAVVLLSGCHHASVRHHYPAPVRVVETPRPVQVVEHREVVVHEHHHETRPPVHVVVPAPRHQEPYHDHQRSTRVVVTPAHPIKVVPPRPAVRVSPPVHRQEERHQDRYRPQPQEQHRRDRHPSQVVVIPRPPVKVIQPRPPVHVVTPERRQQDRHRPRPQEPHRRDRHPSQVVVIPRPPVKVIQPRPPVHVVTPERRQQDRHRDHQPQRPAERPAHQRSPLHTQLTQPSKGKETRETRGFAAQVILQGKPKPQPAPQAKKEKPSGKPQMEEKRDNEEQHHKRDEHRRER